MNAAAAMKPRKVKVFWKEPELQDLAAWVVEMRSPDRSPELSILEAVRMAQDALLGADRHKQLRQVKNMPPELIKLIQRGFRRDTSVLKPKVDPDREPPPEPVHKELAASQKNLESALSGSESQPAALAKPGLSGPAPTAASPWEGVLRGFLVDILVDTARRLLSDPLVHSLAQDFWAGVVRREITSTSIPSVRYHNPEQNGGVHPKKSRLRKILIVGLKPSQRPVFESRYQGQLACKFWCDESIC